LVDAVSFMDQSNIRDDGENWIAVRQCTKRRQAQHYGLVLSAAGIDSKIDRNNDFLTVYVAPHNATRANDELTAFDSEEHKRQHRTISPLLPVPRIEVALIYWALMLFFFAAARNNAFSFDWLGQGAAQAGLMLEGEWWRALTALTLHVATTHLLGNLVFGTVFLILLSQVTGAGIAWLSMVVAGAAGNAINALVQFPIHTSIGASTGIFAGLGLLSVMQQIRRPGYGFFTLRGGAPLAGGVALLAFLGFSGENTDILAHILGFACGIAAGWMLAKWQGQSRWQTNRNLQWLCGLSAATIMAAAWLAAIIT
jgi:rhomboid protease GluP